MVVLVSVHLKKLYFSPNLTKQHQVQEVVTPFPLFLAVPGDWALLVLQYSAPPGGKTLILRFFSVSTEQCQLQEDAHSFTLLSSLRVLCSTGLSVLSMRQDRNWVRGEHTKRLEDPMPGSTLSLFPQKVKSQEILLGLS